MKKDAISESDMSLMIGASVDATKICGRYLKNLQKKSREWWRELSFERKEDGTITTELDLKFEKAIIKHLRSIFPKYGFLGEETGKSGPSDSRWIIDGVDGSDLILHGIPGFSSMIAFEFYGEIILGVINDPLGDLLYIAMKGQGSFLNDRRIRVSETGTLADSFLLHSGHLQLSRDFGLDSLDGLMQKVGSERGIGDCLGWIAVAKGEADIGLHYYMGPEDIAAPMIIIEEAGGVVTDWYGEKTIYSGHAVASNGRFHDEIIKALNF